MGWQRQRRATLAIHQQKAPPPSGRPAGPWPLRPRHSRLCSRAPPGAQQQPFFLPDLVLTFLLPSLLFFSFLDFLVATASAAASTAASTAGATMGAALPAMPASAWISSSVTGTPDISFW